MKAGSTSFEMYRLSAKLQQLVIETRRDARKLIYDAAKGAVRTAIEMTPPGWHNLTAPQAKARGEKIVSRDIKRVFSTASYAYGTIKNPAARSAFWFLLKSRKRDFNAAMRILNAEGWNARLKNAVIVQNPTESKHDAARRRGRVPKPAIAEIVTREASLKRYIKERQKMVGFWAAGWMPAAIKLKVSRVRSWVKRHASIAYGSCDPVITGDVFKLVIKNKTGFRSLNHIVPYAIASATMGLDAQLAKFKARALKRAGFKTRAAA